MAYDSSAYDLSLFETRSSAAPKQEVKKAPQLRQIKNPSPKKRVKPAKFLALALVIFSMMAIHVGNNAMMTEARARVKEQEASLADAQSRENLLDVELEELLSIQNIDAFAQEKLGLCKPEQYQVEYLTGECRTTITVTGEDDGGFMGAVKGFFDRLLSVFGA